MKSLFSNSSRNLFLACCVGLTFADVAQACSFNITHPDRYVNCLINEAKDAGSKAGNDVANQLKSDAKKLGTQVGADKAIQLKSDAQVLADEIIATATTDAAQIKKDADKDAAVQASLIVAKAKSVTDKYFADSAPIDPGLYKQLASRANATYSLAKSSTLDAYSQSVSEIMSFDQTMVDAVLRAASDKAIKQNATKLLNLHNAMTSLDREGQMALNRILRAIPLGSIDKQSECDMPLLAKKFGLLVATGGADIYANNIPGDIKNSNFSICGGGTQTQGAGGYGSVCFAMNVAPESNSSAGKDLYKMAIVLNAGVAAGYGVEYGGSLNWAPGPIIDLVGNTVGLQATVPDTMFGAALSWDINPAHWEAIPTMSLAFGGGSPASSAITEGATVSTGGFYWAQDTHAN